MTVTPKMHKGVAYWPTLQDAQAKAEHLCTGFPHLKIRRYDLGWAIQTYNSGPYFPLTGPGAVEDAIGSRYNPENWDRCYDTCCSGARVPKA